jgi:Tol biopolymer transport system component
MKYKLFTYFCLLLLFYSYCKAQIIIGNCNNPNYPETSVRECLLDSIKLFMESGGRLDILDVSNPIVTFDKPNDDGYYDVYISDLNKNNEICLTCNSSVLPQKHNGQPAWHPSGEWIVFQSEKTIHKGKSRFSTPGRGVYNDLWITNNTGSIFIQLTDLPIERGRGVLHPHFSDDGKKLSWCELYEKASLKYKGAAFGIFKLKVADFIIDENGNIRLENIKEYIPEEKVFY